MYDRAYQWVNSNDIGFVSIHDLLNPPFTEENVSNVVKYSDIAYSEDVHFVKHMHLDDGQYIDDTMNSTIFLVNLNGDWNVVNIRSIADKK